MMNILDFVHSQKLPAVPFKYNKGKNGKYSPARSGFQNFTYEESKKVIEDEGLKNGLLIINKNKYIVFDTDTIEAHGLINKFIEVYKLTQYFKTPSYSHVLDKKLYYKNHYYFKVGSNTSQEKEFLEIFKNTKINVLVNGLDILNEKTAEHKKTLFNPEKAGFIPDEMLKYFVDRCHKDKIESNKAEYKKDKLNLTEINFLLESLKDYRANDYIEWRNIGLILKSAGCDITLFNTFSKNSPKYNKEVVEKFYNNITPIKGGLGLGTLIYYCKIDNPERYEEYKKLFNKDKKDNYLEVKEDFEKDKFKVMNPLSFCYLLNGEFIQCNKQTFKDTFENVNYEKKLKDNKIKKVNFVRRWLTDETLKTYDKLDFLPKAKTPPNVYNTFTGFEVDKKEVELDFKESLIYKHIYSLICNEDEKTFNFFMMWLSNRVKNPCKLPNVSIVLRSEEGSGKGCFLNYFGKKILGSEYYLNTQKIGDILGKFNEPSKHKILIVLNEIKEHEGKYYKEELKEIITEDEILIQAKGINQKKERNTAGFIFTTNNFDIVGADKNDRRYSFISVNDSKKDDEEYFKKLMDEMDSGKYDKSFYNYLISLDSDNFNFKKERPESEYKKQVNYLNTEPLKRFIIELYNDEKLKEQVKGETVIEDYKDWLYSESINIKVNSQRVGIDLKRYNLITGVDRKKVKGKKIRFYNFNLSYIKTLTADFVDL